VRLLRDYLPKLPRRGRASDHDAEHISANVIAQVEKAVRIRNRLSHQGKSSIESGWLADWLILYVNLLYLFDFYGGQQWALQRLQPGNIWPLFQ
jgi:hypothetical protein